MLRIFVDMDGTLAEFKTVNTLEALYEKGYFINLEPMGNVLRAIRLLAAQLPQVEVFTLSAYLTESKYAYEEKNKWLDRYLPGVDQKHRVFCPVGANKKMFVPDGVTQSDFLLDDYTKNLLEWIPAGTGVKLLNGINHTRQTWTGNCISAAQPPQLIVNKLVQAFKGSPIRAANAYISHEGMAPVEAWEAL